MTGYALATALAAPVDDGMMLADGARPLVVHDAHDNRHRRLVLVLVDANHQGRGL